MFLCLIFIKPPSCFFRFPIPVPLILESWQGNSAFTALSDAGWPSTRVYQPAILFRGQVQMTTLPSSLYSSVRPILGIRNSGIPDSDEMLDIYRCTCQLNYLTMFVFSDNLYLQVLLLLKNNGLNRRKSAVHCRWIGDYWSTAERAGTKLVDKSPKHGNTDHARLR
jgi:hypothetical protein